MLEGDHLPRLEGSRVNLRGLEERDIPGLLAIFGDFEVTRFWPRPALTSLADARKLYDEIHEGFRDRSLFEWGVALREDDEIVGICTLHRPDVEHRRAELGYALGRDHWGQGYMCEALGVLLDFFFDTLKLHRLEADVDPRNRASIRSLEALGFVREGVLRERWHCLGEIQDSAIYGLLAREWRHRKKSRARVTSP